MLIATGMTLIVGGSVFEKLEAVPDPLQLEARRESLGRV